MALEQNSMWILVCLDGADKIIDYHGVYDTRELAENEAKRMNGYEGANHPNDDIYYDIFKEPVIHNYRSPLGRYHE